jgi:hypothetical protein
MLTLCSAPAQAADPQTAQSVQLEAVGLPVVADGRLVNYVFVSVRLDLWPAADGAAVRGKEQFFRDDLVRVGHRRPFTLPGDYTRLDERRIQAEIMRAAVTIVGPGSVRSVQITKQASQRGSNLPSLRPAPPRTIINP